MKTHFIRTVTNVGGGGRAVYQAEVRAPEGSKVTVEPSTLVFRRARQRLNFLVRVEVEAEAADVGRLSPGSSIVKSGVLTWTDGRHQVRSPIAVTMQAPI